MAEWKAEYRYRRYNEFNDVINDVYRYSCSACGWNTGQQGITFQFCPFCGERMQNANNPRVVPMARIEAMKKELPSLVRFESADGQDLMMAADVCTLIEKYCREG